MSKVTAKYQVTIPVKVRKELGIVPGTEVDIKKEGQKYTKKYNDLDHLFGIWTDAEFDKIQGNIDGQRKIDRELWE